MEQLRKCSFCDGEQIFCKTSRCLNCDKIYCHDCREGKHILVNSDDYGAERYRQQCCDEINTAPDKIALEYLPILDTREYHWINHMGKFSITIYKRQYCCNNPDIKCLST